MIKCKVCQTEFKPKARKRFFCSHDCYWKSRILPKFIQDRFWSHVDKSNDCWEWQKKRDKDGYGIFTINGDSCKAHRKSYEYSIGEIPNKLLVLHRCDNPSCVKPSHLFLGTHSDNARDMVEKGRSLFGARHKKTRLIEDNIIFIREAYANKEMSQTNLAIMFGITQGAIEHIINNRSWKHI